MQSLLIALLFVSLVEDSLGQVIAWGDNSLGQTNVPAAATNIIAIAAGNTFVLALKADSTVTAWGSDTGGEIDVPAGLSNVVAVAGGNNFSLALKSDGTVTAWGDNSYGVTNVPAGLTNVTAIAAANEHVLALKSDGTVVSWGYYPLVGPVSSPTGVSNAVAIAAGEYTGLAIKSDRTVTGWGPAANGELHFPVGLTNVAGIAGGGYHCVAVRYDGLVVAWGFNGYGETNIPVGLSNVVGVAAGLYFSAALKSDGSVVVWGDNAYGQKNVPVAATNSISVVANGNFLAALSNNGAPTIAAQPFVPLMFTGQMVDIYALAAGSSPLFYQWQCDGTNIDGATNQFLALANLQLSDSGDYGFTVSNAFGMMASSNVSLSVQASAPFFVVQPTNQASFLSSNVTLSAGVNGSFPFTFQWQAGGTNIPDATNATLTLTNLQLSNEGLYDLVASNALGFAVSSNLFLSISRVVIWGTWSNQPPGLTNVIGISGYPAALKGNGRLAICGPFIPDVSNLSNVVAIASGIALFTNGTVKLWNTDGPSILSGSGSSNAVAITDKLYGDLELRPDRTLAGSVVSTAPVNIQHASNVVAIAEGGLQFSLALTSDGKVLAWGNNTYGQTNVPGGLSNVVAIAAGYYHALALKGDGTIVAWGGNLEHETNTPPGLSNVVAIAAGDYHSLALRKDGKVVAWGYNAYGETNVPPWLSNVVMIAAGAKESVALIGNSPPVLQTTLPIPAVGSNTVSVTLPTQSGRVYALEFKQNMGDTNWTALPLNFGTGTDILLQDTQATNSQRFYRVRKW